MVCVIWRDISEAGVYVQSTFKNIFIEMHGKKEKEGMNLKKYLENKLDFLFVKWNFKKFLDAKIFKQSEISIESG
jgi:hypothetical protein